MHELNTKYCIDCKPRVEITVKWEKLHVPSYTVLESVCACAYVLYNNVYICLQSFLFCIFFFFLLQIITKLKPSLADIRRKGLCLSLIFSAARFRLLSDLHIAEQGACRALRAGSLIVEGKKKKKKSGWNPDRRAQCSVDHCV